MERRTRPTPSSGQSRRGRPRRPRVSSSARRPSPLLACRIRVPLPDGPWIQRFSRAHPDVHIEVLNRLDLGRDRTLTEVRLRSPEATPWEEEIRTLPGVLHVDPLGPPGPVTLLRVVHRTSAFVPIFRRYQLMRRFPFPVEAGVATWVVVGPEIKVRRLLDAMRSKAPDLTVESVRHDSAQGREILTPRQEELFRRAMAEGYFEVPRRVTLTALAARLGMAVSSLSEALAIIEKKLLEERRVLS